MRFMQGVRPRNVNEAAASEVQGLAGWVLGLAQSWRESTRGSEKKQLRLVEITAAWREEATDVGDVRGGEFSGWGRLRQCGDNCAAESRSSTEPHGGRVG